MNKQHKVMQNENKLNTFSRNQSKVKIIAKQAQGDCEAVADPENFGGGIIKILSTKPQKFGCLHRN